MERERLHAHGAELHQQQRWPEAVAHWRQALSRFPDDPMIHFQLGIASFSAGALDDAERCFAALRARFPQHPGGWLGRGLLAQVCHHWDQAAQDFAAVMAAFPDLATAFEHHAQCMVKLGRIDQARTSAGAALRLDPQLDGMRAVLAYVNGVRKSGIVNALVAQFGLRSYLEYNKFTGQLAFDEVLCAERQLVFFPEPGYRDRPAQQRVDAAARKYADAQFLSPQALLEQMGERRFDLIFLDPLHVRPAVDHCLQALPALLAPGGFLLVHDCNPEDAALTTVERKEGQWLGETYKAFALFHRHNRGRSLTVAEDFGVGIICNDSLCLDYDSGADIDYATVAADRPGQLGLISHAEFRTRLAHNDRHALFR